MTWGALPVGALMEWPTLPLQDPVLIIALVTAIVLLLPLFGRFVRVPDIVLLILAGMFFGEYGVGVLQRDQAIELLGAVGLLYIMFLAGLEINVQDFFRNRHRSILLGVLSFIIPQAAGMLLAVGLLGFDWIKATLLASMLASFTLLTYPQVSRLGLNRKESVTVTVGATLITDTLALLVLAVIVELHRNVISWTFVFRMAFAFSAFLAIVLIVVPYISRWFFRTVGRDGGAQFLFVLLVVFLSGSLSGLAGVEPIIGAFLAGLTLNRLVPPQSALMNRVEFMGRNLFIPFFLVSVGMIVDPRVFVADRVTWMVGGTMVITVLVTKWTAAMLARKILGYTSDEGWVIFGLTVTQAAATLAAVVVGFELQIFDEAVLNGTLMMILVTCMISPWITDCFARRVALSESVDGDAGGAESGRFLIPVDNPSTADSLAGLAVLLRGQEGHDPLLPLRVVTSENEEAMDVIANERMLFSVMSIAAAADMPTMPLIRVASGVGEGIRQAAIELRASTVLLGWSNRASVESVVFGDIMEDVLQTCGPRVMVCHLPQPLNTIKHLKLAIPPHAHREVGFVETMQLIWRLAHQIGASLTIVAPMENRTIVEKNVNRLKPKQNVEWIEAQSWTAIRSLLLAQDPNVKVGDTLRVLLTAREGGVSWRPGLNRMPTALSSGDFQNESALLVYPSLISNVADQGGDFTETLSKQVVVGGVFQASASHDWPSALKLLVKGSFGDDSIDRSKIVSLILNAAADFPVQLVQDVILVHVHTSLVKRPRLLVLAHPEGLALVEDTRASIILILLVPIDGPPDRHLQVLSMLARLVKREQWVQALIDAKDHKELLQLVQEHINA